jgi:alpha-mannosidase
MSILILVPTVEGDASSSLSESEAAAVLAALGAPWHPAILGGLAQLPRFETLDKPSPPTRGEVRLLPAGLGHRLVSGYSTQASDAGVPLIECEPDRLATVRALFPRLGVEISRQNELSNPLVLDFFALGTACWMIQRLAAAMNHADCLDRNLLGREVIAGARALNEGDEAGAQNRLRAAFECLTQARERFYPVDDYLLDLILLDARTPAGALREALDARVPVTLIATGEAIDALATGDPQSMARLAEAVNEGWADVVGGPYQEVEEPLLPVESILWQYRRGAESYRAHLDSRSVETLARRRFGLYPMQPQIARRFGIRFAFCFCLDEGRFPLPPQSKRLWEAADGSSLEALTRPPVSAERACEGLRLPERIARSMKEDHVATIPLAHWPDEAAGWYEDLRRVERYSPVFGRWTTAADYFHLSDRPWDTLRPAVDDYQSPYLAQAVRRGAHRPVSHLIQYARLRGQFDTLVWIDALVRVLERISAAAAPSTSETPAAAEALVTAEPGALNLEESPYAKLEHQLETGEFESTESAITEQLQTCIGSLKSGLRGGSDRHHAGYLILNPLGWSRRTVVELPDAPLNLPWTGALRASQLTDVGVMAVVDLPADGFVWIDLEAQAAEFPGAGGPVRVEGSVYANGRIEVEIDSTTGGLRSVRREGDPAPRLAQQLVVLGLQGPGGEGVASRMIGEGHEIEYAGPALAQGVSRGKIVRGDSTGATLARFEQRIRLWHGQGTFELELRLLDLESLHADEEMSTAGNPWASALACRWAWSDADAELRCSSLLGLEKTGGPHLETSEAIEIASRGQRTHLLVDGLPYHRRHGPRMLDTLLIPLGECERAFRLRVSLDTESAAAAVMEARQPAVVVATDSGCPRSGASGWFFRLDQKGVAMTRAQFAEYTNDGRGWGFVFHLLETANRATRCRLRLFRDPASARLTDFQGDHIVDLEVEGDAVLVDLTPRELARIEVTLGERAPGPSEAAREVVGT